VPVVSGFRGLLRGALNERQRLDAGGGCLVASQKETRKMLGIARAGTCITRWAAVASLVIFALGTSATASATTGDISNLPSCGSKGSDCSFEVSLNGQTLGTGNYLIGDNGDLLLPADQNFTARDGSFINVTGISGNADPILGFSASAGTGNSGAAFVFSFSLPISLAGPVAANSQVSYSLTAKTDAGAEIKPLLKGNHIIEGLDVDTSVGGLPSLNKHVGAGDKFTIAPGIGIFPRTENSAVFSAANSFITNAAYDQMTVVVAFALSPNSEVGLSGFVQQVPEPSVYSGLAAGLLFVGFVVRRRLVV